MSISLLKHDRLFQCSARRELGVEDLVELLQSSATRLDAEEVPDSGIYDVEADENQIVPPVNRIQRNGRDICVVEIGAIGQNDVL